MNRKMWFLSLSLHSALVLLFFLAGFSASSITLGSRFSSASDLNERKVEKRLQMTEAKTISASDLQTEIAKIKKAEQNLIEKRALEKKEHEEQLRALEKEQKKVLQGTAQANEELSALMQRQENTVDKIQSLEQEVSDMQRSYQDLVEKKKTHQREQSFSESVFKESLYSDGTVLQAYRDTMAAHISSYWKKNKLIGISQNASCVIEMKLLPTSRIESLKIEQSSGYQVFDTNALASLSRAEPFPKIKQLHIDKVPRVIRVVFKQDGCGVLDESS